MPNAFGIEHISKAYGDVVATGSKHGASRDFGGPPGGAQRPRRGKYKIVTPTEKLGMKDRIPKVTGIRVTEAGLGQAAQAVTLGTVGAVAGGHYLYAKHKEKAVAARKAAAKAPSTVQKNAFGIVHISKVNAAGGPGDKRNTKYVGAASAGALAGRRAGEHASLARSGMSRKDVKGLHREYSDMRSEPVAQHAAERLGQAMRGDESIKVGDTIKHAAGEFQKIKMDAPGAVPGLARKMKGARIGGRVGAVAGVAGYAAYRHQRKPVAKGLPEAAFRAGRATRKVISGAEKVSASSKTAASASKRGAHRTTTGARHGAEKSERLIRGNLKPIAAGAGAGAVAGTAVVASRKPQTQGPGW